MSYHHQTYNPPHRWEPEYTPVVPMTFSRDSYGGSYTDSMDPDSPLDSPSAIMSLTEGKNQPFDLPDHYEVVEVVGEGAYGVVV